MEQKSRPLVVHHYYPFGSGNIGDHLVARALRASITKYFGPADFVDMPVNDCYRTGDRPIGLRNDNIDRSNAEADLVLVGGSNLLEPRKRHHFAPTGSDSPSDWGVFTDRVSIQRLRPPLLLAGMGTGSSFGKGIRRYSPRAREEIRLLHSHAFATAVRDEMTASRLSQIGVHTECVGCPVTFLTDRAITAGDSQQPLIVSFPPSRIVRRFGGKRFMRQAMTYIEWLRAEGVRVVVTVHEAADLDTVHDWVPRDTEIFYSSKVEELVARYENCRGVIGFRLHAALLGLGLGKPVVMIGLDWRSLAAIQTLELQYYSIRAFRWAQFLKLRLLTDTLLRGNAALIGRLDLAKARFSARYDAFFREAACRLTGACGEQELSRLAPHPAVLRSQSVPGSNEKKVA
ncbi:MAG TPA: polysaccharide pyruvyl transferase family protein [Pirellulales bacterium]|nr:polysaccharide pyruvyl transferase family protein [Pirellulales bacterium]